MINTPLYAEKKLNSNQTEFASKKVNPRAMNDFFFVFCCLIRINGEIVSRLITALRPDADLIHIIIFSPKYVRLFTI